MPTSLQSPAPAQSPAVEPQPLGPEPDSDSSSDVDSTKHRILDAALALFAEEGFERVSLRALTQSAGVNLASVNYHFGSKDALIDAVIHRVISPVNEERLGRLTQLEQSCAPGEAISVRDLLEAFLVPVVSAIRDGDLSQQLFLKLMGRCMSEPGYRFPEETVPQFREIMGRFGRAIAQSRPNLTSDMIMWRLYFSIGTLVHSLLHLDLLNAITGGKADDRSADQLLSDILDYCTGGFDAPVETPES